ncbi:MAG: integrase [Neobacillus sp.]|jgi:integrase|nr:integrase [Neobacillus sp.]
MKGYIRKRGTKWAYTVDIGKDPLTGKRKQKSRSGFKTKKEAQAALAELVNTVEKGNYHEPQKRRFKEFAIEYFENSYKNKVKKSSYETDFHVINTHLIPFFGEMDLNDIDQFLIHKFYSQKIEQGLSSAYIHKMHNIISLLLQVAHKWEILRKDIIGMVEPPRVVKKEINVWNIEQINTLLEIAKHSRYFPIFYLAAYTGMRKGEILGLTWNDVDFDEKMIYIKRTLYKVKSGYLLQEPKTQSSNRSIYMDDDIIKVLKNQKEMQDEERMKYDGVYKEHQMVFAQETGEFVSPSSANTMLGRFVVRAGLPPIRFHDLRHTHATILLQMGVNPKIVAERLGHSSVHTTLDTYSHVLPGMKKELSELFSLAMKSGQIVSKGV